MLKCMENLDICHRFRVVIDATTVESRKFKELEECSGIPSVSWRKAYCQGQKPTVNMLEFLARRSPEFAFWLISGVDDSVVGHIKPEGKFNKDIKSFFSSKYFKMKIAINHIHCVKSEGNIDDVVDYVANYFPDCLAEVKNKIDAFNRIIIGDSDVDFLMIDIENIILLKSEEFNSILLNRINAVGLG